MMDAIPSPQRALAMLAVSWLLLGQVAYRQLRRDGQRVPVAAAVSFIVAAIVVGLGILCRVGYDALRYIG